MSVKDLVLVLANSGAQALNGQPGLIRGRKESLNC
jgi:hypothetical protein